MGSGQEEVPEHRPVALLDTAHGGVHRHVKVGDSVIDLGDRHPGSQASDAEVLGEHRVVAAFLEDGQCSGGGYQPGVGLQEVSGLRSGLRRQPPLEQDGMLVGSAELSEHVVLAAGCDVFEDVGE